MTGPLARTLVELAATAIPVAGGYAIGRWHARQLLMPAIRHLDRQARSAERDNRALRLALRAHATRAAWQLIATDPHLHPARRNN